MDIADILKTKIYEKNEIVMRKGEVSNKMFILIQGRLGIYYNDSPDPNN